MTAWTYVRSVGQKTSVQCLVVAIIVVLAVSNFQLIHGDRESETMKQVDNDEHDIEDKPKVEKRISELNSHAEISHESYKSKPGKKKLATWNPHGYPRTVFSRVLEHTSPAEIFYEDDQCIAFQDTWHPEYAPHHFLVIPRKLIQSLSKADDEDEPLLGHMMMVVKKLAKEQGLADEGYRVVINDGSDGGQGIMHLHIHVFGGRSMGWPPG